VDIGDPSALASVRALAGPGAVPGVRREAAVALATLDLDAAIGPILELLPATTDEAEAQAFWRDLLGVRGVGSRLAAELPKIELPQAVARAGLRPAREGNRQAALVNVLMARAGLSLTAAELTPAEMRAFAREALLKGDAARGVLIYRRAEMACMACHAIGGAGGKLGPDLTSIGASAPADYLVDSMLYPNAKIKEGYHAVAIGTKSGRELSGMILRETPAEILLRDAANQEISIPANDVARRTNIGSLMPAGLMDGLLPEERLDLINFLAMLGKPGEYDAARGGVARYWQLYYVTSLTQQLGVERAVQGDTSLEGWIPAYSFVNGFLPAALQGELAPGRSTYRPRFAAARFDAPRAGTVTFAIDGKPKGVWVNGAPVEHGAAFPVEVGAGRNLIVLQLDEMTPGDLRLRSDDVTFVME
jgi:putative heme-binding domain-containing protein